VVAAGFAHTWPHDQGQRLFRAERAQQRLPVTPNDPVNAGENGQWEFTNWQAKINATIEAPWEVKIRRPCDTSRVSHSGARFGEPAGSRQRAGAGRSAPLDYRGAPVA
jgi:hypothetical protein